MKKRVNIRNVWTIVASLAMFSAIQAQAAAVIYEPFADGNSTLTGNTPGTGLTGTWAGLGTVTPGSLVYGALPVGTGNKASFNNQNGYVSVGAALSSLGLLDDGAVLWFSVIVRTGSDIATNGDLGFAFGTDQIGTGNNIPIANSGQALGARFKGNQLQAAFWAPTLATSSGAGVSPNTLYCIVGKFTWSSANDTVQIYNVATDLTLTLSSTYTTPSNVNQSTFDTISIGSKTADPQHLFSEIRFGATQADVLPVDTVAPSLVSITDNKAGGPIGEDVTEVTYTLTFDRPMDLTTITAADFDNVGTATATVGTPAQVSPAVISVKLLPTTTGTLQLRIPSGSVLKSLAGLDLATTSAILDDTTITINSGTTPVAGTLYWDGPTTSGVTDGASQGGTATWDTTSTRWDLGAGFEGPFAWNNSASLSAVFGGTAGTVTLGSAVSISNLTINSVNYTIQSNTLNFATGASFTVTAALGGTFSSAGTIRSAITGAPLVVLNITGSNTEMDFLPDAGSMQLGAKSGATIALGGSTTGNTLASSTGKIRVSSGEWTLLGNASGYQHYMDGGTFIVNGQLTSDNRSLKVSTNATLVANGTVGSGNSNGINFDGNAEGASTGPGGTLKGTGVVNTTSNLIIRAEATLAPGYPTGTLTITNCDCTINGKLAITVNGSQNSTLAMDPTKTLTISSATLNVNVTATPSTQLTIATYGVGKLIGTFASHNLPTGWTITYDANGGKAIVLTPPAAGTVIQLK